MTFFEFKGKKIAYTFQGKGFPIVLLHGYLETKEVWSEFAAELSKKFQVITIDIPGHGSSELLQDTHHMCLLAEVINALLKSLSVEKCLMVGHSMGGYVALAYADFFAHRLAGLTLFHSSIYADTDEKRKNRLREIEFIMKGKTELIINSNLPNVFANGNAVTYGKKLDAMKNLAKINAPEGVCALLRGMMDRPDRQELIAKFKKPILFVFGKKDSFIPEDVALKMLEVNKNVRYEWLEKSGHIGFVEEFDKSLKIISNFATSVQVELC